MVCYTWLTGPDFFPPFNLFVLVSIPVCAFLRVSHWCHQLNHPLLSLSLHHSHKQQLKQSTGKHHYLWANPSHGVRQLQTLHVTTPCHLHIYISTHTWRPTLGFQTTLQTLFYFIFLSFALPPSLHVILCHSPGAKLHWSELPQYWGIVSYTGNFLPRCQAYFTLICLQRLLIKQSCLYTYLYRRPACATLHTALNSMLLNIYLRWMSAEEE